MQDLGPNAVTASVVYGFAGLNNVVEGRIAAPFGTATYTFTLAQATTLVFDGLSDDPAFQATLTGPDGLSLNWTIAQSDSFEFTGDPVFAAAAGTYNITVSETAGHIGSYAFRLIDVSAATPISVNTPVNFTLPAGFATQAFSFTANAGDQLIFNSLALPVSADDVSISIIDPLGRLLTGPLSFSVQTGIPAMPLTGTYTLLIQGRTYYDRDGALAIGFALDRAVTNPFTLQIGAPNPSPGPVWGGGLVAGQGVTLTGADDVTFPAGGVTAQTGSFTVEAMVNLAQFDGITPIVTDVSSDGTLRAYGLYVTSDGAIVAATQDGTGDQTVTSAAGLVSLNKWSDIAMVVDRTFGTLTILLNGSVVGTTSIRTEPGITVNGPLVIGATNESGSGYGSLVGTVDYVRVWSIALTQGALQAAIATAPAANSAGLVLDLPFTEGTGTVSANIAPPGGDASLVSLNTNGITGQIALGGPEQRLQFRRHARPNRSSSTASAAAASSTGH